VLETGLFPSFTSSSFEGALDVLEGLVDLGVDLLMKLERASIVVFVKQPSPRLNWTRSAGHLGPNTRCDLGSGRLASSENPAPGRRH
jgi:hypothetical protein